MKAYRLIVLFFVCVGGLAQNKTKKHSDLSAAFENARYAYIEAKDGGDLTRPGLFPEDRQAISDVQAAVEAWNRYAVTTERNGADLIFIVRKGRLAGAQAHGGISAGSGPAGSAGQNRPGQGPPSDTLGVGAEVGPEDDLLQVFSINSNGKLIGPIWSREMKDGLEGPRVPLLRQLRDAVEQAYPNTQPKKQP